ncbi:MAG: carboxypeptidase-like regulatory domain-containing protein [Bryobacteraceae bacterium]
MNHTNALGMALALAAVLTCCPSANAFTTCIVSNAVVPRVQGRVVSTFRGQMTSVAGAQVNLWRASDRIRLVARTDADSLGRFLIPNVAPGEYVLRAEHAGLLAAEANLYVKKRRWILFPQRGTLVVSLGLAHDVCPFVEVTQVGQIDQADQ